MSEVKATVYSPDSATWPPEWPVCLVAVADYDAAIRERDEARAESMKFQRAFIKARDERDDVLRMARESSVYEASARTLTP